MGPMGEAMTKSSRKASTHTGVAYTSNAEAPPRRRELPKARSFLVFGFWVSTLPALESWSPLQIQV